MYSDHLVLTTFDEMLKTSQLGKSSAPNEVWDEIDSTNSRALLLANEGAPHGVVVAARMQTAGRGRQGRTWVSPPDAGLYISFLLRPQVALTELPLISLATGSAVARAVHSACGLEVGLKWVNDVIADGRKLGGILAEMSSSKALVIGIGLNVRAVQRPPELANKAVAIEDLVATPVNVNLLAANLAWELEQSYNLLCRGERTMIIDEWKRKSVTLGKTIRVVGGGTGEIEGLAVDLARDGALIVRTASGDHELHAGEISIRNADGSYA
jgi:BirA family biotin operon repressor/biotin-[acetyl-CoA-carboxylase] ligase